MSNLCCLITFSCQGACGTACVVWPMSFRRLYKCSDLTAEELAGLTGVEWNLFTLSLI